MSGRAGIRGARQSARGQRQILSSYGSGKCLTCQIIALACQPVKPVHHDGGVPHIWKLLLGAISILIGWVVDAVKMWWLKSFALGSYRGPGTSLILQGQERKKRQIEESEIESKVKSPSTPWISSQR